VSPLSSEWNVNIVVLAKHLGPVVTWERGNRSFRTHSVLLRRFFDIYIGTAGTCWLHRHSASNWTAPSFSSRRTTATGRAPNTPAREQVRSKTPPYSGYGHAYAICRTGQALTGAAGTLLRRHNQTDVTATTPPTGDGPSAVGSNDPGATFLWWGSCVLSEWGGREYRVDLRLSVFPAVLSICTRAERKPVTRIAAFSAKHRQRTMSNRLQRTFIQKLANENISKLF
jgi:hypothetical protein